MDYCCCLYTALPFWFSFVHLKSDLNIPFNVVNTRSFLCPEAGLSLSHDCNLSSKMTHFKVNSNTPVIIFVLFVVCLCYSKTSPDCLCRFCRLAPLLFPGGVHLDVPRGRAALHHAGGGVWEWALSPALLLPGGLWSSHADCGRLRCRGLPQLWNRSNVSTIRFVRFVQRLRRQILLQLS